MISLEEMEGLVFLQMDFKHNRHQGRGGDKLCDDSDDDDDDNDDDDDDYFEDDDNDYDVFS